MGFLTFRFGRSAPLMAVAAALSVAGVFMPAKAGNVDPGILCPNLGFSYNSSYITGTLPYAYCGTYDSAAELSIPDDSVYSAILWGTTLLPPPYYPQHFPYGTTLGDVAGTVFQAQVSNLAGNALPYYQLVFLDNYNNYVFGRSDQLQFLEVPTSTVSGGYMTLDPNTTLFYLQDVSEPALSPSGEETLTDWLAAYPGLADEGLDDIYISIGDTGGTGTSSSQATVDYLSIGSVDPVPEPITLIPAGLGLVALCFTRRRRVR